MSFCQWERFSGSEVLAAGRYDGNISRLELQFKNGKTYEYFEVPVIVWLAFCGSNSKGTFFNSEISRRFVSRPVVASGVTQGVQDSGTATSVGITGVLGSSLINPFRTSSIPYAFKMLEGLHFKTSRGIFKVHHRRLGSRTSGALPEPVDHYQLYVSDEGVAEFGGKPRDFFVYSYSSNPHSEESLPGGLIYVKNKGGPPLPVQAGADGGKSYLEMATQTLRENPKDIQSIHRASVLLRKAAELNNPEAQELLFTLMVKYGDKSKKTMNEAMVWWHRAQRTKEGLPNSPATDYKPGVMDGGCMPLIIIGILLVGAVTFFA